MSKVTNGNNTPANKRNISKLIRDRSVHFIKKGYKLMILMRGLPGTGKTRLARKLLKDSLGAVDRDEFIFSSYDYFSKSDGCIYDPDKLEEAHGWNQRKVFSSVKRGVSPIIIDDTNLKICEMKVYCAMAVEFGYFIEIVEVAGAWALNPETLALQNIHGVDKEQIKSMLRNFERGVTVRKLLKKFQLVYTTLAPQFREYPLFSIPFQTFPLPVAPKGRKKKRSRNKCAPSIQYEQTLCKSKDDPLTTTDADQLLNENTNAKNRCENSEPTPKAQQVTQTIDKDKEQLSLKQQFERFKETLKQSEEMISKAKAQLRNKEMMTASEPLERLNETTLKQSEETKEIRSETVKSSTEESDDSKLHPLVNERVNLVCNSIRKGYKIMVLMRGLPGSGKTCLATKILNHSLRAVNRNEFIFSTDDYFNKTGRYIYNPHELQEAYALCQKRVFLSAERGVSPIIIDDANLEILEMEVYCNIAVQFGYLIKIAEVATSWALNPEILSSDNTRDLKTREIERMLERYERGVTTEQLLNSFKLIYTVSVPQYRKYPSFSVPNQASAVTVSPKHAKKEQSQRKGTRSLHNGEQLRKRTGEPSTTMDANQFLNVNTDAKEKAENSETALQAKKIIQTTQADISCHISSSLKGNEEILTSKPLKRSKEIASKQSEELEQLRSKTVRSTTERNGSIQLSASVNNNVVNLICDSIRKGYKIIVLMRGLPGSGKTYLATKILNHSLRGVNRNEFIFSTDDYFNKSGRYIYNPHELQEAYALCQKKVFLSAERGVSPIIIDDANLEILEMEVYCNIAVQFGYLIEIVEITTPWVITPKMLSLGNTRDLKTKKINAMVKRHERDVTTEQLLSNFNLVYTVPVPQYREYPSFAVPIQPSATVVPKDADQFLEMNTNAKEKGENSETLQAEKITGTTYAGIR